MAPSIFRGDLMRRLSVLSSRRALSSSPFAAVAGSSSAASSSSSSLLLPRPQAWGSRTLLPTSTPRVFFTSSSSQRSDVAEGPTTVDYRSVLQEDEFHRLADGTIHDLLGKLEEYGDEVQMDGFDIDYGNQVLTLKLGALGTYVINKQTPNRQIWLSSPVSGPSRFDWDSTSEAWVYRRTKANLLPLLEDELKQLCGKPISFS